MSHPDATHPQAARWNRPLPGERLEDGELQFEPLAATDVPDMTAVLPAGECGPWGPQPGPLGEAAAAALVEEHESGRRAGERLAWTGRLHGGFVCGVVLIMSADDEAELAYWTAPAARGRGYATRALILAAEWALGRLGLRRVWLEIEPANAASQIVAARAGFTPTAHAAGDLATTEAGVAAAGRARPAGAAVGCHPQDLVVFERVRMAGPPEGYILRPAVMEDAQAVFELQRRCELHDLGEPVVDLGELRSEWESLPGFDLSSDTWVIERQTKAARHTAGRRAGTVDTPAVAGYGWFLDERDHELLVGDHCVDPAERGRGLETVLMDRLDDRARREAARSATGIGRFGVFGVSTHEYKPAIFEMRGFRKIREFLRLERDLGADLTEPQWPAGLLVSPFRLGVDEAAVHAALSDSFSEHFREAPLSLADWKKLYMSNPRLDADLWLVARDGPAIAGVCLSYVYPDTGVGHIDQLGVGRAWRRRGLGTALLYASFKLLRERGCRRAVLGVDAENVTGAARIYERAGTAPRWRTDFYEKPVRPPLA
jgi:mycothiol synthase